MNSRFLSCVIGLVLINVSVSADPGDIILRDEFTGAGVAPTTGNSPTDLNGRTPDTVNLPGGNWAAGTGYSNGIYNNYAWLNADIRVTKSIASTGAYTKPSKMTISADVNHGWTDAATRGTGIGGSGYGNARGIGVGFFEGSALTGVVVGADGSLNIVDSSPWHAPTFIDNLHWAGSDAFDPSAWYHLTYTIDTATGDILSLEWDDVPYSVATTTAFGDTETDIAGFYVNSYAADTYGYVDSFQVMERIPEPSTLVCLALAGLLALRRRR